MSARENHLFDEGKRHAVEAAIEAAEKRTAAEFVVVVAERSGRYDRAEDLFGLVIAFAVMAITWLLFQNVEPMWGDRWGLTLGLLPLAAVTFVGWVAGTFLAIRFPVLARPFLGQGEMLDDVKQSAAASFHRFRVRRTADAIGVLVYVSLYERQVWVVGDDNISAVLDGEAWAPVRDRIVDGFRRDDPAAGLVSALALAADLLADHFPVGDTNPDELPNTVHFIDA